jgi:hypothetical protein
LCRASTSFFGSEKEDVDGRVKPGHDDGWLRRAGARKKIKKPRPAGGPGGALTSGAPLRQAGQFVQMAEAAYSTT